MTDQQPDFVATESGFGDALTRRSRRRRRRHASIAATSALAVIAVGVVALSSVKSGRDSLTVPPAGASQGHPSTTPAPSPGQPASGRGASTLTGGVPPSGAAAPITTVGNAGSATTDAAGHPMPVISTTMQLLRTSYDNTEPCSDLSGRAATGWCIQVNGPFSGRTARPTSLSISLCRLPGVGASAHFSGTLEADFGLQTSSPDHKQLWQYAHQHPNRTDNHSYQVNAGACLTWTTTWRVVADNGQPVKPGTYTLVTAVHADNVANPNQALVEDYNYTVNP